MKLIKIKSCWDCPYRRVTYDGPLTNVNCVNKDMNPYGYQTVGEGAYTPSVKESELNENGFHPKCPLEEC